jgi:soluble lytic murein transglycosylase-like protein
VLKKDGYDRLIKAAADRYQVDHTLIKAVIKAESNFNAKAVSPKGAQGLMQLMPKTAAILDVEDSFEPESNIEGDVRYLRYLINVYDGGLPYALAAYNAGEKAVARTEAPTLCRNPRLYPTHFQPL